MSVFTFGLCFSCFSQHTFLSISAGLVEALPGRGELPPGLVEDLGALPTAERGRGRGLGRATGALERGTAGHWPSEVCLMGLMSWLGRG